MPRTRSLAWSELKIGLLTLIAIVIAAGVIFLLSGEGGFFWQRYTLKAQFPNAGGLKTGLGHLTPGTADFNLWVGLFFFVPVVTGGICGLLGGYLTDLFGRRRVLVSSILLYGVSAAAAAPPPR